MRYQDKDKNRLRGIFPDQQKSQNIGNQTSEDLSSKQYYAVSSNEMVKRFEVIQTCGKRYNFSYSTLPVCIQVDSSLVYLKAYELLITIKGRGLDAIRTSFSKEELVWIKASHSGKDDGTTETFIEEILVEGNAAIESI